MKKLFLVIFAVLFSFTGCQYSNNKVYEDVMKRGLNENTEIKNDNIDNIDNSDETKLEGVLYIKTFDNLLLIDMISAFEQRHPGVKIISDVTQDYRRFSTEILYNHELYYELYQSEVAATLMGEESRYDLINISNFALYSKSDYLLDLNEFIKKENKIEFNIDDYNSFLKKNFKNININSLPLSVDIIISKNIYDYFYYDISTVNETMQKCQNIVEIYLSE